MYKWLLAVLLAVVVIAACNNEKKETVTTDIPEAQWWKEAVVYQLYPRSFKDSDEYKGISH